MYHCHIQFYITGRPCQTFEIIREMPALEHFSHQFTQSSGLEAASVKKADVIIANLEDINVEEAVRVLCTDENKKKQVILLADAAKIALLTENTENLQKIHDIWTMPMSDAEIRFRFLKWQQAYKEGVDYWQTSQYLEATINHTPTLVWYKTKDGIHEKVNDSFCRAVNKTREQVEGRGHAYIWDVEEDDPACIESENIVMEKKQTCVSEEVIKTGEGMRTLTTYKSPLYDYDGSVMGTVGVAIDATQERAYEEEITKKNQTLETIFTTIDCGVIRHTIDGAHVLSINRAALEILGYDSYEELMEAGFNWVAASVADEDKGMLQERIRTLKNEGDSVNVEYRVRRKNGEILHVMGNVKLLMEDGELVYQRFLLDCTAQKMQEKQNERHQNELIQALGIDYNLVFFFDLDTGKGMLLRDDEGKHSVRDSFFDSELALPDSMERYIREYVYEEDEEKLRQAFSLETLKKELEEKEKYYVNYRAISADGIVYFQMKAVRTGVGKDRSGIVLGLRNIDEEMQKEIEQKKLLEDALSQANRASKAKSAFLSNMSHDIRTPMNAIVGFTNLAIKHIDNKTQVEEYLGKIMTSGNHLLNLINDVLDMSHIESGKIQLEENPCSISEVVNGLHNILQADINAKQLTLQIETVDVVDDDVYCDKLRLNQVLLNLLGNAVKYTEEGGMIHMRVTEKSGAPEGFAAYEFYIKDNGIGMSPEFVEHIFEPFEREKTSTISGIQGTGLGMAITKNIVDMMHGTITVKSKQGVGSEFTVIFPFRLHIGGKDEQTETDAKDGVSSAAGMDTQNASKPKKRHTGRILLAEDVELNQEIAVAILGEAGFEPEVAGNGQIAVEMLEKSEPGYYKLILMDVQMPVMNGYEATRAIRKLKNKELASIPIIAMTANAFEEDKKEALKCGMNGHIAKPIDIQTLFDTLDAILS
ncbi:MAG: ATP-binding protein [Bacillus sp. (in: Bacteria)]|nr:ATP-binding protein [Bacillus sp. (in: firmicutes)]MCM1425743.1 ATP-binding protein [Eubacterium sp.]